MKEFFSMNKPFKKYLPIYMIMLSIVLLMGTSYALLRSSHQGENTYTMNVGTLQVTFVDSATNALTLENAYPMTDDEGMSETKELTFTVKNTGTVTAKYSVYIEETSTSPEFKSVIRFISNKNDAGYNSPKTLSEDKYIDSESSLGVSATATYKVKAWISDTADSTYMDKTFTARVVVSSEQATLASEKIKDKLKNKNNDSCQTYIEEDGVTYVSGTKECIDFNYVWYSGKMWRIVSVNQDGTMKMITDDAITSIAYNPQGDVNFYDISKKDDASYTGSYIYQWLNEDFLDTLYNYQNIIVEDSTWNITNSNASSTSAISTKLPETTLINNSTIGKNTPVGLLNSYEYYLSYKNTSYGSGYLNIGYWWWLLNPYSSSTVWGVNDSGNGDSSGYPFNNYAARPSINLKSNIQLSGGSGTKDDPYTISGDKEQPTINTTLLNTRTIGEYVVFDEDGDISTKEIYRIVGFEDGKTKLNKNDYIKSGTTTLTKKFSTNTTYGNGTTDDYWDYYLNNTWYNSLAQKSMLDEGAYYIKQVSTGTSYKNSLCNTNNTNETTKTCTKTTTIWTGLVGIPRYGEMFASQQGSGYNSSSNICLITPYSSSNVRSVNRYGISGNYNPSDSNAARPSINLKSNIVITGGSGTKSDPFTITLK